MVATDIIQTKRNIGDLVIVQPNLWVPDQLRETVARYNPRTDFGKLLQKACKLLPLEMAVELIDSLKAMVVLESELLGVVYRGDGTIEDLGTLSKHVITDAGVGFLVDAWQNSVELENMRYHGFGSGTTNEAASQTALITEFTTEYATDNTRPTGSLAENAANIFESVATFSPDSSVAVTEHGIFSQASNAGGVLWDRSKFNAINLTGGSDSLQTTYRMTATSGG